jgi:uncharacterized protein GlcG (DUF336 family)
MSNDQTTSQANVSAALARQLIDAARSHADGLGKAFTIAIVDASGHYSEDAAVAEAALSTLG